MAESSDLSSNSIFDILTDWNDQLKHSDVDFNKLPTPENATASTAALTPWAKNKRRAAPNPATPG